LNVTKQQWKNLHQLLYDENSHLPPPLEEQQRETLLQTRQERLDTALRGDRGTEGEQGRKEKTTASKAWKLGYL
jgi:hypothetical protein